MAEDNVYVSITNNEQRKYRSEILLAQTDVLNLIKMLGTLKGIRQEKANYRLKLAREFSIVLEGIKRFNEKMPNPKIPKSLLDKNIHTDSNPTEIFRVEPVSETESTIDETALEKELQDIQEQLRIINQ